MRLLYEKELELSVIMPCLNEQNTVGQCIDEAFGFIGAHSLSGEVIVVDNGSSDASAKTALEHGAVVVPEGRRGYGRAIRTGLEQARGAVMIFADCDTTYDFLNLDSFFFPLKANEYDIMIGDRLTGLSEKGSIPFLHRLGVPFLSACGRIKFKTDVRDFHCGLRSLTRQAAGKLDFVTDGMEFATEMIAKASREGLRIGQTPVGLRCCRAVRKSKLRTFSDGFRHLKYIILN